MSGETQRRFLRNERIKETHDGPFIFLNFNNAEDSVWVKTDGCGFDFHSEDFFYGKRQGKRAYGYLIVMPLATPCNIGGATGALPAFKVEIDALFEGTHVISTWKHCRR